nr:hypothetical protein [Tanacetum cinerariifolium]
IQQYLQIEHYALWEVIEFRDSYKAPKDSAATSSVSDGKNGRTVAVTTEDMQKRRNDVKARITLLLALPDEHQLRFSKKMKKNQLKQQYGNFKVEGKETLEQTFNRLQAIAPKALMAIDGVGWDWSYMEKEEENHALVADEEAPTKFSLVAKSSTDNEVEARLVEFKNQEIKFCEKIRGLEFKVESKANRIKNLTNELETLKKEKEGLDSKLTSFKSATKDLENLIRSQRSDKIKEGL